MNGFVLVKGKAGLGNRMLSAMTGILYAMLSSRKVVVDWSDRAYSDNGESVFPRLFAAPNSEDVLPTCARDSVRPALWADRLNQPADQVVEEIDAKAHSGLRGYRKFSFDLSRIDYPEKTLVMWSYTQLISRFRRYFRGSFSWMSSLSDEELMRWLLQNAMILQPDIMENVEAQWRNTVSREDVIGVHIRYTDKRTPLEPYYKVIDKLLTAAPNAELFLATDNLSVQKDMVGKYKRVVFHQKWLPTDGQAMHYNASCPDRAQSAIDALTDMYMLSKSKYLVFCGSSTFSYLSSVISSSPYENIIDIERSNPVIQLRKTVKKLLV
jgi:hypothetical protein